MALHKPPQRPFAFHSQLPVGGKLPLLFHYLSIAHQWNLINNQLSPLFLYVLFSILNFQMTKSLSYTDYFFPLVHYQINPDESLKNWTSTRDYSCSSHLTVSSLHYQPGGERASPKSSTFQLYSWPSLILPVLVWLSVKQKMRDNWVSDDRWWLY